MDPESRARRQSLKVIISEAIMVLAVIATVSILAFVVSGYWVSSDFTIERQGMLQIYSSPSGANVEVDGNVSSWLQRTNTSKTLSAGEHTVVLTKDGYDSWSRTITVAEGLLYRLHYPRLFLKNRKAESAFSFSADFNANNVFITPSRNTMLLATNTTKWQLFNLDSDNGKLEPLDLSSVLPFTSRASGASTGLFSGVIQRAEWATDNEHLLLKIASLDYANGNFNTSSLPSSDNISGANANNSSASNIASNGSVVSTSSVDAINWLVINIKNPSASINLTKEFNADFSRVEILDNSASNLLVVMDGNLHRVDVSARQISAVLVPDIADFDYYNQEVVFSAKNNATARSEGSSASLPYHIGLLKLGSGEITELKQSLAPERMTIFKFYDEEYIGVVSGATLTLYLKRDFSEKESFSLSFSPGQIKVSMNGDAITMYTGGHLAVLDMEAMELADWSTGTDSFGWLDGSMIYAVQDGDLQVYDFNGLNPRTLAGNVSAHYPITITSDRYLYYFRDGSLIREYLTPQ